MTQDILDSTLIIATRMTTRNREQTLAFRYLPFARASCFSPLVAVWHPCVLLSFLPCYSIEDQMDWTTTPRFSCSSPAINLSHGLDTASEGQPIWTTQTPGHVHLLLYEFLQGTTVPVSPGMDTLDLLNWPHGFYRGCCFSGACQRPWTRRQAWITVVVALQLNLYCCVTLITLTACTHELAKQCRCRVSQPDLDLPDLSVIHMIWQHTLHC